MVVLQFTRLHVRACISYVHNEHNHFGLEQSLLLSMNKMNKRAEQMQLAAS